MIFKFLVFVASVHLSTLVLAAWYGIPDHWYHIRDVWPKLVLKLAFWTLLPAVLYISMPAELAPLLVYGFVFFACVHCLLYLAGQWLRASLERKA